MVGKQHQRAPDQVGGVLMVRRPCFGDLQMQRLSRRLCVEHRRNHQPQDARANHRASVGSAGEGTRIGAGGERQHGDRPLDRRRASRGFRDGAHFVRYVRTIVGGKRVNLGHIPQ